MKNMQQGRNETRLVVVKDLYVLCTKRDLVLKSADDKNDR